MTTQDSFMQMCLFSLKWLTYCLDWVIVVTFVLHFKLRNMSYWTFSFSQGWYQRFRNTFSVAKHLNIRECWWTLERRHLVRPDDDVPSQYFSVRYYSHCCLLVCSLFLKKKWCHCKAKGLFYFAVFFLNGRDQCFTYSKVTLSEKLHVQHSLLQNHWLYWVNDK